MRDDIPQTVEKSGDTLDSHTSTEGEAMHIAKSSNKGSNKFWSTKMGQILRRIRDRRKGQGVEYDKQNDLAGFEMQVMRNKPEGLDVLCDKTKFTKKELQIMYRGFKQECPTGIVNEETFNEIYAQFFPQGVSATYAHYVFNTFDQDHNGTINFGEFVKGLSVLARGTVEQKLLWAFSLYDVNGDGIITKDEMLNIVSAIYDMMGKFVEPTIDEYTAKDHVERIFERLDTNKDGVISIEEFMEMCCKDDLVSVSMCNLDTVL